MQHHPEIEVALPHVTVQLATVSWEGIEEAQSFPGYHLSQRLSDDHPPLRIGNVSAPEVLPRVRAVGLLPPGRAIRLFPVEKPLRVLHCMFEEDYFEGATQTTPEQWKRHTGSLVAIRNQRLEILMQEICAELEQPGFGREALIGAVATMILVELGRYIRELERKSARNPGGMPLAPWQLRRIQERIEASAQQGYPALEELAEICGISQGHLARSYKASTGWPIHKFIAEERMQAARRLLAETQLSCEEVSLQLGFKSPTYFSTAFRRMTGKTPTEFRKLASANSAGGG